jgi:hypothetical protein
MNGTLTSDNLELSNEPRIDYLRSLPLPSDEERAAFVKELGRAALDVNARSQDALTREQREKQAVERLKKLSDHGVAMTARMREAVEERRKLNEHAAPANALGANERLVTQPWLRVDVRCAGEQVLLNVATTMTPRGLVKHAVTHGLMIRLSDTDIEYLDRELITRIRVTSHTTLFTGALSVIDTAWRIA